MKLAVITISVREQRVGHQVAQWIYQYAQEHSQFSEVELIDLKALKLPIFNEPFNPRAQNYQFDYTKNLSRLINPFDAFIFVTPEYNHFTPGSFVNLIDYLAVEWNYKPAAIVSYGGISGGLRSAQAIKPVLTTVRMMPIPEGVSFHSVDKYLRDGQLHPEDAHINSADFMLSELTKWAQALKTIRENKNP